MGKVCRLSSGFWIRIILVVIMIILDKEDKYNNDVN